MTPAERSSRRGRGAPFGNGEFSVSSSGQVLLLDAPKYARKTKIADGSWPGHIRFLSDDRLVGLVSSSLRVWDAKGTQLHGWANVSEVAYSGDDAIAAIKLDDGSYGLIDLRTASQTATYPPAGCSGKIVVVGAKRRRRNAEGVSEV